MRAAYYFKRFVLPALLIAWILFVITAYYGYQQEYLVCDALCRAQLGWQKVFTKMFFSTSSMYFYVLLALYGALSLWSGGKLTLTLRPVYVVCWLYFFAVLSLTILLHFTPSYITLREGFIAQETSIVLKLSEVFTALSLLTVLGLSIGSRVLRAVHIESDNFLYSITTGWLVLIYALFVLATAGILQFPIVVLLIICLGALSFHDLKKWLLWVWNAPYAMTIRALSLESLALLIVHAIIGYSMLDAFSPVPFGWDGTYRYLNTVQLISASHHFISGVFPYPFELLMTIGPVVFRSLLVSVSIAWLAGLLSVYALYSIARTLLPKELSVLTVALFCSMPMMYFMLGRDVKVDFASLLFALTALRVILEWRVKHARPLLIFAGILLGTAVTIKFTTAFFAAGILGLLVYLCWQDTTMHFRKKCVTLLIFCIVSLIPLLPWIAKNIADVGSLQSLEQLLRGRATGPDLGVCTAGETAFYTNHNSNIAPVPFTGTREELQRYVGYEPMSFWRFLAIPWHATMNPNVSNGMNEIGPGLLILLPLIMIGLLMRKQNRVLTYALTILTGVTFILWKFFGYGINWYALPAFSVLIILALLVLTEYKNNLLLYRIAIGGIVLSIAVTMINRLDNQAPPQLYMYLSGSWSETDLKYYDPPLLQATADIINDDAPTPEDAKYVYNARSPILFRIYQNDQRVFNDFLLDSFNCISASNNRDINKTFDYLVSKGFAYITWDPSIGSIDKTPEQSLVAKKKLFTDFIDTLEAAGKIKRITEATDTPRTYRAYAIVQN